MIGDLYIRLGSGQARKHHVGGKGAMLDKAAHTGLPVPRGVILMDTTWDQAVLYGFVTVENDHLTITEPDNLSAFINLPPFERKVAVRSAFSIEDGDTRSLAGFFTTVLNVDPQKPEDLARALEEVWNSAMKRRAEYGDTVHIRRDILIMEMVNAVHAGVAFTEREYEDDLVNYTEGLGDRLVGGTVEGKTIDIPKLRGYERKTHKDRLPDWAARLQGLLRDVRRWLGNRDWDIEWADDGKTCYLLQVRPITAPTRRNEAFTIANHKEILPELPSTFMTSIVESSAPELFAYYRQFDSTLPKKRPFIEVFYGRPYINLSLMSDMMRIFGLPTRLVTDNIGGETNANYGLNLRRMINKIIQLALPRFALAQLMSVRSSERAAERVKIRMKDAGGTYTELVAAMRWLYISLVTEMFSLTAAIGPMLSLLRRLGVLEKHRPSTLTVSAQMIADLEPMQQLTQSDEQLRHQIEAAVSGGDIPEHPEFRTLWDAYIETYGHRGIYESDIARPRYHEDPAPLLNAVLNATPMQRPTSKRSLKAWLTFPLWWQANRTMQAREMWRHRVMKGFDEVRTRLLEKAAKDAARGILPSADALWMLTLDEVQKLDHGWNPEREFFTKRQAEIDALKKIHLPDLFHRFDDLEQHRTAITKGNNHSHLHGISLTSGKVEGKAWVLREPESRLPEGYTASETILVARSVDAGWISTFGQVAGVVVETGGDLSHGSIILRELGLPAVTNVSGVTRATQSGDHLTLNASNGSVEIRSASENTDQIAEIA